ncbi:MAG: sugar transferase [Actinomycetota bacterium]
MSSPARGEWQSDRGTSHGPHLELVVRPDLYQRAIKPIFDRVIGSILLIVSSPLLLVSIGLARIFIGKPVIYRQPRVGLGGRTFELYKIRTMIPDRRTDDTDYTGPERRKTHKSEDDPRVLPLGKAFRATRLDELPQLWNVVRGDMSLVGPRPELPEIVAGYEDWQHRRHEVTPGLTGLWQVSAFNGKPMHQCTDIDLKYIEEMSFATDLSILLRTPAAMLRRKGY